ncbi:MAG: exo-alpha-sialidase [Flavisolibacter sp.]|jgi:hypothetical protein|nr:exo-alpha-sialidase [Flavisolibacter sp.]
MKNISFVFCLLLMVACKTSKLNIDDGKATKVAWNEDPARSVGTISFGVPAINKTVIQYRRNGKDEFAITLSEPKVIVVADKPQIWGYYQFPTISRLSDKTLHADWSMHLDAIQSYGTSAVGSALSKDGGSTWQLGEPDSTKMTGFPLANGEMIKVSDPKPIPVETLKSLKPIDKTNFKYRKTNFTFYKLADMPSEVNGIWLKRMVPGQTKWNLEKATLIDPMAVRYSSKELVPVVWWGDIHTLKDGSLLAGVYPGYYLKETGEVDKQMGVVFHRSTDNGRSWKFQGRIPFNPDRKIDVMATDRIGFTEPTYEVLADGSLLCVIRSADGDGVTNGVGNGPMYASHSTDNGVSWTKPEVIAPAGALPRLLRLQNGVLVLSAGRPGVQLRFSKSGLNDSWTDGIEMLPYESQSTQEQYLVSCGYTGLLATGPNRFLMIYSDFRYKNEAAEKRKAIKVREIIVDPK